MSPESSISPYVERHYIGRDVCFLISNNLLMFDYIFFSLAKLIYPGSSLTTLEEFLRAIREAAFPGHSSQVGDQIEHNFQLFSCMFFFRQQLGK